MRSSGCPEVRITGRSGQRIFTSRARSMPSMTPRSRTSAKTMATSRPPISKVAIAAWGLRLCAKEPKWYSNTVSAIMVPHGIDAADVIDAAFRRYNLALGAGLSKVAGKLFRIGHLGDLNDLMVLGALAGAEMAMRDVGIDLTLGSGVAAAQMHFRSLADYTINTLGS